MQQAPALPKSYQPGYTAGLRVELEQLLVKALSDFWDKVAAGEEAMVRSLEVRPLSLLTPARHV